MAERDDPPLYLRRKVWWTWVNVPLGNGKNKRRRLSTGQRDRALAKAAARRLRREWVNGAPERAAYALSECLAAWLATLERVKREEVTQDYYRKKARHLLRYFGPELDVHAITMSDCDDYLAARKLEGVRYKTREKKGADLTGKRYRDVSLSTIAKELGALRSALKHAKRRGLYRGDPSIVLPEELRGAYSPRDRALSREEYPKLWLALSAERRDYLIAYVGMGPREGELYRITADDVRDDGRCHIHGHKGKRDRADRLVPMRPEVAEVLVRRADELEDGQPLFAHWDNARRDLAAACKRAGIVPVTHNDLRRTFATWLCEEGVPEHTTSALMGHASSAMVRRVYSRIGADAQRSAIDRLPSLLGPRVTDGVTDHDAPSGRSGQCGQVQDRETTGNTVPRDGIEPPIRGFSIRTLKRKKPKNVAGLVLVRR
jgi:integrase